MLTAAQQKTLDYIRRYWLNHGRSPSLAEIARGIGITSRGTVHRYVQGLIEAGHLIQTPGRKRGLQPAEALNETALTLPLLGRIAAGQPIEAILGEDTLDLAAFVLGGNRYALRVKGDSMIEAAILDGDTVVIAARATAEDGEIVVALIDQSETTLKRLKIRKDGSLQLTAANATIPPMIYAADRVRIQGVVVGVLRSYR